MASPPHVSPMQHVYSVSSPGCRVTWISAWVSTAKLGQYGSAWVSTGKHGSVRVSMGRYGPAWVSMGQHGSVRVSMGQHGSALALGELDLGVEWHEQQQHSPTNRIQSYTMCAAAATPSSQSYTMCAAAATPSSQSYTMCAAAATPSSQSYTMCAAAATPSSYWPANRTLYTIVYDCIRLYTIVYDYKIIRLYD